MNQTVQAIDPAMFGAWGQWAGAAATVLAVGTALWIAIHDDRRRAREQARPLILPALGPVGSDDSGGTPAVVLDEQNQSLRVLIRNAGVGPALFVRTEVEPGGHSAQMWSLGALAPGDIQSLLFTGVTLDSNAPRFQLLLDYRSTAGLSYATSITIEVVMGVSRAYDVRVFEKHSVTHHGDAVYPQRGLRDVRPRTHKSQN